MFNQLNHWSATVVIMLGFSVRTADVQWTFFAGGPVAPAVCDIIYKKLNDRNKKIMPTATTTAAKQETKLLSINRIAGGK